MGKKLTRRSPMPWVIEFRNGAYFQNLEVANSGPLASAQRFATEREASDFMAEHEWIVLNGGMVVPRG